MFILYCEQLVKLKLDSGVPVDVREVQSVPVKLIDTAAVSALEREWPMDLVHTFEEARQVGNANILKVSFSFGMEITDSCDGAGVPVSSEENHRGDGRLHHQRSSVCLHSGYSELLQTLSGSGRL